MDKSKVGYSSVRVYGVSNFYLHLEHLSEEGAKFTSGYFGLVVVSALLATGGLLANSIPVIIGSMCISKFRSFSVWGCCVSSIGCFARNSI
jgi:hypothetical protein